MRAAIYARVSTGRQELENQLLPARQYLQARQWELVEIYSDEISAVKRRPGLERMLADARARRFDVLVVVKLDRLARSMRDLIQIIHDLDSAGVRLIVITQGIDTDRSNPASRLLMNVLGAIAEFERELIRERVIAGLRRTRKRLGRPRKVLDRVRILDLRAQGMTLSQIARHYCVSVATVKRRLHDVRDPIQANFKENDQ